VQASHVYAFSDAHSGILRLQKRVDCGMELLFIHVDDVDFLLPCLRNNRRRCRAYSIDA